MGARLEIDAVPVAAAATRAEALAGGEDYELLATLSDAVSVQAAADELRDVFGTQLTHIGTVTDSGLMAVTSDGDEAPLEPAGWDHFRDD